MTEVRIFIDDEREPPKGEWLVARSAAAFALLLEMHAPSVVSFDHDLGCDEADRPLPSGQDCMLMLINKAIDQPATTDQLRLVILHSANPVGRANMRGLFDSAQRNAIVPNATLIEKPVTSFPIRDWVI